ncbi:MAG: DUF1345 domain-containing protein [Chitinophagaceae bacterium]
MSTASKNKKGRNVFLRMHPLQRILLSLGMSLVVYLLIRNFHFPSFLTVTIIWNTFAVSFICSSWVVFFTRTQQEIVHLANKEDGSRPFVLASILISAFASMFAVLLLMISKDQPPGLAAITTVLSVSGMMASWVMVHTIFTFHYAHMYYFDKKDGTPDGEPLDFPGEKKPDYLDFAYFAFIIGMTFQVSDVEICSSSMRRTALAHSLLSFALNTFVVALTINLIAGLKK